MAENKISMGGQAVIEGVIMRSPTYYAVAVRTPQGQIVIQKTPFVSLTRRIKILNIPIMRGAIHLIETMILGVKSLTYSAEQAMDEEEAAAAKKKSKIGSTLAIFGSVALALVLGFALFFYVPLLLTELVGITNGVLFNLVDGVFRVLIFLLYIYGISRWKEMRRVFQYHGAEHKTIYAFESGRELKPEAMKEFSTHHPRCGTSFLIVVIVTSIIVFMFLGRPESITDRLIRFSMIPLIGGISYEIIKLAAKERFSKYFKLAIWPGLALQRITTQEPSDDMLEVAIAALHACLDYQSVELESPST